tara:strand:- start:315 stop:461 length:147 start_codon:yes stop_codon:yes gene_type:complete
MKKLTKSEMIAIIKEKRIDECNSIQKKQVMVFAFGEDFMNKKKGGKSC